MKRFFFLFSFIIGMQSAVLAQLPNGSVAPDFTVTDLNGNSHNLYSYLNAGKTVYLDFFATWCGPCWNYHQTHALQNIWTQYGPSGTNEAVVIAIEGSASTNTACIYGPSGCNSSTYGNWTTGITYPIVHTDALTGSSNYNQGVYPTIYMICPSDKKIWQAGQNNAAGLWSFRTNKCINGSVPLSVGLINKVDVKCLNTASGRIDILPQGGFAPLTYSWSNGSTFQDLVNISAGTYTVTVTGQDGTTAVGGPYVIENPPSALVATGAILQPAGCNGVTSGKIEANPTGGWNFGYFYNWNNGATTKIVDNLGPGLYQCTVTDNNYCTKTMSLSVQQAGPPTVQVVTSAPAISCSNPTVQLNASGSSSGSNQLNYQWSVISGNIVSGANTATPTVNQAGAYEVVVTDAVSTCTASGFAQVNANLTAPVCSTPTQMNISCSQPTVTLTATALNGTQYLWTASNGGVINGPTNQISCTAGAAGTYVFTLTNTSSGCTATSTTQVVNMGNLPNVSATAGTITCATTSASLSASSTTSGVTYAWSGPGGFTSNQAATTTTTAGTYTVVVTSTNGCTSSTNVTVAVNNTAFSVSLNATSPILNCNFASANLSSTISPSANYTYQWTLNGQNIGSNANYTATQGGTYQLTATNPTNGCTSSAQTSIIAYPAVVASATVQTQVACFGNSNGAASSNATGGAGNFQCAWSNGATTNSISSLAAGTYTVVCTDAQGCSNSATVTITQPASAIGAIASATGVTSSGGTNGTATVNATGGTSPYSYLWSNGQTTASISGLTAGNYTVVVTDANNCTTETSATVQGVNCALTGTVNTTPVACFGGSTGTATVSILNATAPITYAFNGGGTGTNLPAGNYSVTATDGAGCALTLPFTITQPSAALAVQNATTTNTQCANQSTGTATLGTISGGTGPYTINWSNGGTGMAIGNLSPGTYTASVTDANGCAVISNPATVAAIDATPPTISCPQSITACATQTDITYPNPTVQDNCALITANIVRTAGPASGQPFAVGATTISFSYTDGGQNAVSCSFTVTVTPAITLASSSVQNGVTGVTPGTVTVSVAGGTSPFTYSWTNAAGAVVATTQNLSTTVAGNFTLQATDANGCTQSFPPFAVNMTISAQEPEWMQGVSISPNPAHDLVRITWDFSTDMQTSILDMNGRVVHTVSVVNAQQLELPVAQLPEGMYLIRMQNGQEAGYRKLVKQ